MLCSHAAITIKWQIAPFLATKSLLQFAKGVQFCYAAQVSDTTGAQ